MLLAFFLVFLLLDPVNSSKSKRTKEHGEVAEWSMASVLKTEVGKPTVGSNPTLSAIKTLDKQRFFDILTLLALNSGML